jgi:hypothetical protein
MGWIIRVLITAAAGVAGAPMPIARVEAQPAQVLLMRHGHKDPNRHDFNLSPQGFQRAQALSVALPACFGSVQHILTFVMDPETSKNARSYQTAVPLAVATGVNIRIMGDSRVQSRRLGEQILRNPLYRGRLLVVFWEHRHLPELAAGLGWPDMPPIADNDFDRLDQLTYANASSPPQVRRFSQQRLLDGSESCVTSASLPL